MAVAFNCPSCGEPIIVKFLGPGETAKCRHCGTEVQVPADARETGEEPRYVTPKGKTESAAPSSEEQAAQDALASFFIGMAPFLGGLPGLTLLWIFVAPYGLSLASRGKKSQNRLFAQVGQILCIAALIMYGLGIIIGIIYAIVLITYMPRF
jgi:hypothetical protein